jgi:hypothetical protein
MLVEHEQRNDLALARRGGERRVIGKAQVLAAIPDEGPQVTC